MSGGVLQVEWDRIRWGLDRRIPAVVEDRLSGGVLMVGWVNREALEATVATGFAHFDSRSQNRLWMKGETSGNILKVQEICLDCDGDTILYRVDPAGPTCHTGTPSCFGSLPARVNLGWLLERVQARRGAALGSSYTARLLAAGLPEIARKVGEEAVELAVAASAGPNQVEGSEARVVSETADLLYHLAVLWEARGIPLATLEAELRRRTGELASVPSPPNRLSEVPQLTPEGRTFQAPSPSATALRQTSRRSQSGRRKNVRVHVAEFLADSLTPVLAFERLAEDGSAAFLLESVTGGDQVGRYSFVGASPRVIYRLFADRIERDEAGHVEVEAASSLKRLQEELESYRGETHEIPFLGGFVGSFGFDLIRLIERLPNRPQDPWGLPIAVLGRFDEVAVFDHARQRLVVAANEIDGEISEAEALRRLERVVHKLAQSEPRHAAPIRVPGDQRSVPVREFFAGPDFEQAVVEAKEEIVAGEIFQVVLARRFAVETRASPLSIYRALRRINPSPYMVLLRFPEVCLVGASPEALVQVTGRMVRTRPIAGTRRRGETIERDLALEAELLADPKERAEHLMLVDLGRNDLGRVAVPGTVRVERFQQVERYSHVMHLVSTVEAELAPGRSPLETLLAAFPAGTVSGAPKLRAIEILDRLEPEARGFYAGATGYLSYSGNLDTCITIRTLVLREQHGVREVSVTAGAGVVADSDPTLERRETENKAAALLAAVELAEGLEE